jgi:kynureninase
MAHEHPFDFTTGPVEYAERTRFLRHPGGAGALRRQCGIRRGERDRVPAIRRKSERQVEMVLDLARARGITPRVPATAAERGGMVILDVPHGEAVTRELLRREVLVDYRPGAGIRLSPHFYTSDDELRRAVDEIASIRDSGAYARYEGQGGRDFDVAQQPRRGSIACGRPALRGQQR